MNAILRIFIIALIGVVPAFADSFRLTEVYADKLVRSTQDGVTSFDTTTTDSGSFSGSLQLTGLSSVTFDSSTTFAISLGGFSFAASGADASKLGSNSVTFLLTADNPVTGKSKTIGRIVFSRKGDTLKVRAVSRALDVPIAADTFAGMVGPVTGEVDFEIAVGDLSASGTVALKGISKVTSPNAAGVAFPLDTVRVLGSAGTTRPAVSIVSPQPGEQILDDVVTVSVKAIDNVGVDAVAIWANSDEPIDAILNGSLWQADVGLVSGTNTIQAQATSIGGNVSRIASVNVIAP